MKDVLYGRASSAYAREMREERGDSGGPHLFSTKKNVITPKPKVQIKF
jgi:hypothetical protein